MTDPTKDLGVITALLKKFSDETLPRALGLKKRVDAGERLEDWDIEFMHLLGEGTVRMQPLIERCPDYQDVYARMVQLYTEIAERALDNEKGWNNGG